VEPFEVQGEWWTPANPEHKVGGTLRIDVDKFRLFTINSLSPDELFMRPEESPTRILGQAEGKGYTLDDCLLLRHQVTGGTGGSPEQYGPNRIIRGAWFGEDEDIVCKQLFVRMKHLASWFGHPGISRRTNHRPQRINLDVSFKSQRATIIRWRGGELRISHWFNFSTETEAEGHTVREDRIAGFRYNKLTQIEDALAQASDLQDLVTMATGRQAEYISVSFTHPDIKWPVAKGRLQPIDFIAGWTVKDESTKRSPHPSEMLFTFDDIHGRAGIAAWMEVAQKYRTELGRVVAARYRAGMAVEDRFFNCAAALQGVDETATGYGNSGYRTRLRRLANRAGPPFVGLVGNIENWIDRFKYVRDDHAHHYKQGFSGTEHLFLGRSAYWLFVIWMLREAQFPASVFDRIVRNADFEWEGQQIRALLGS
jgi:ApeA N-terminal domain 1